MRANFLVTCLILTACIYCLLETSVVHSAILDNDTLTSQVDNDSEMLIKIARDMR